MNHVKTLSQFAAYALILALTILAFSASTSYAATTNVSILHGWNGTDFVPIQVDSSGRLKTTLNLTESTGLFPDADNLRNIGTSLLRWAAGYFVDLFAVGDLTVDTNTLFVDSANDKVGIGTTSPAEKLVVIGKVNVSDSLNVTNSVEAGSFIGDGSGLSGISAIPAGAVMFYAGESAPSGWLTCDGSEVSRTTYADLFNAIDTLYGAGDGSTTFNLPNMKGRVPVVNGTGTDINSRSYDFGLGNKSGEYNHTLTTAEMPSHSHSGGGSLNTAAQGAGSEASTNVVSTGAAGGGQPHSLVQPYLAINCIVKT